jgi:thiosulfate dehydrogenase
MPLVGIWGQFPQYRAREGAVELLQDRINGCMERSMNGRALPPEGHEMLAFLSWMRWLSGGVPDGAKLTGAAETLPIKLPDRAADPHHGAQVYARYCAACHGAEGLGQRTPGGLGYQSPPLWGFDSRLSTMQSDFGRTTIVLFQRRCTYALGRATIPRR